jgi:very-short-patch-repair endonuclease
VGGEHATVTDEAVEAPPVLLASTTAHSPPSPALPPSRGKGDHRYTPRAGAMAKRLRRELTYAERLLWTELRKLPLHVRKQSPVGPYVADFLIHLGKLVIEVDGYYHTLPAGRLRDAERDTWLNREGFRVVRFTESEVRRDTETVARRVLELARPEGKGE